MKFLRPRLARAKRSRLRYLSVPEWPDRNLEYRDDLEKKRKPCPFCNLSEAPVTKTTAGSLFPARYPLMPKHLLFTPHLHVESLHELSQNDYDEVISTLSKIIDKNQHVTVAAAIGASSGNAIPHLHLHLLVYPGIREESEIGTVPVRPGTVTLDYVGRLAMQRAHELGGIPHAAKGARFYPSVRISFENWDELKASKCAIARTINSLREGMADLKRNPQTSNKVVLKAIAASSFGFNLVMRKKRGTIVMEIIPRGLRTEHGVISRSHPHGGGLIVERNAARIPESWISSRTSFYSQLAKSLSG